MNFEKERGMMNALSSNESERKRGTISDAIEALHIEIERMMEAKNVLVEGLSQVMQPPVPITRDETKQGQQGDSALASAIYESTMLIRIIRKDIEDAKKRVDL